jgi:uncharacterized alkaline shock family protein YloU
MTGTVTIASSVYDQVVRRAAGEVEGVRVRRRGLDVEVDGGRAKVALEIAVRLGDVIPDAAADVQRRVAAALRDMCGLDARVDVAVEELDG